MPTDIFLYAGEANPNDIRLANPDAIRGANAGRLTVTEDNDTVTSAGSVNVPIFLYAGEANPSDISLRDPGKLAASGINGSLSVTEDNDTVASTGTVAVTGALASTEADDTVVGTGTVSGGAAAPQVLDLGDLALVYAFYVAIDWDNDGSFTTVNDDITPYIRGIDIQIGMQDDKAYVASVGECTLTLDNQDRLFSPLNTLSPYYGKLKDGFPVRIQIYENYNPQTGQGVAYTLFRGVTADFVVATGQYKERSVTLVCKDAIERLQTDTINLPLQTNKRTDVLIAKIVNSIYRAGVATDTVTLTGNLSAGNNVVFTHSDGVTTRTYTAQTVLAATGDFLIGATKEDTCTALAAAINNDAGSGTLYFAATKRGDEFSASVSGAVVTTTAVSPGTWGNSIAVVKSGANITLGGANFTSGTDLPAGLTSYQTGIYNPDYAGDTWNIESETNGMNAIEDVCKTEQGLFFVQRDGTLTFWNRDEIFKRVTTASALTIDSEHQELDGGQLIEDIYNRVEVKYTPRTTLSVGVVAQAQSVIQVPGQSGTVRYDPNVPLLASSGSTIVKLTYKDPTTGATMGAKDIVWPLVPTTDWTANENPDGSGPSYTGSAALSFSVAIYADSVEVSIKNTALGPIYITMLKVRGTGIVSYNPTSKIVEDNTYWSTRGRRTLQLDLPFSFSTSDVFAAALSQYMLSRFKDQNYRIKGVSFTGFTMIGTTSLFGVNIGDLINLSDYQSLIATSKHMVTGISYSLQPGQKSRIKYNVKKVDDVSYWILEDATYGVLGTTTRLAI